MEQKTFLIGLKLSKHVLIEAFILYTSVISLTTKHNYSCVKRHIDVCERFMVVNLHLLKRWQLFANTAEGGPRK
jgi:hypothetical protein